MIPPILWFLFPLSFLFNLAIYPLVRWISFRFGVIAQPRLDRWHKQPTPALGGLGMFLTFSLGVGGAMAWLPVDAHLLGILWMGGGMMFVLGMVDDLRPLSPTAKLVGEIIAATLVIALGVRTDFFTPRIAERAFAETLNIALTFLWLVGLTNAINLLDNMDGLAGGIAFIGCFVLAYFFARDGEVELLSLALTILGSTLGFLVVNFPPAKIFMGDCGSLFLGFTLASLAIARQPQASNVFAVIGVPTVLFLLPILDTAFVAFTRLLRGQSPMQGGRDHTSHRLMAFGLSERQTLLVLYVMAGISGLLAATLESIQYWFSLVLVPLLIIALALFTAYLGRVKVEDAVPLKRDRPHTLTRVLLRLTFQTRILEVLLDFLLIGVAYTLATLIALGFSLTETQVPLLLSSLPLAFAASYLAFFFSGVYRGVWRYVGLTELWPFLKAALISVVLLSAMIFVWETFGALPWHIAYPPRIILLFFIFLFLGLTTTRLSFRLLDVILRSHPQEGQTRLLVVGAGDASEMVLRWIQMNPQLAYLPIGLIDQDEFLHGRFIHGVEVLGSLEDLPSIIQARRVQGIILTVDIHDETSARLIAQACQTQGCWLKRFRLGFEELSPAQLLPN